MPSSTPPDLPDIPELAEYDLVRELGRGGSAVVYLARDRELGRDVAIKLILPAAVPDDEAVARLVREARTVGKLQHPNIVMLLGTRRLSGGGLALILQFVPGRTLKEHIRERGALPVAEAVDILRDIARALAYAHRDRIVHRDVKPENIYLDEEARTARLSDFGIARAWDSDSGLTLPGTAIGTPSYMSPEQVQGGRIDGRSDVYSLGLVAWEMLTGRKPWEGESLYEVIYKQKQEALPEARSIRPDIPEHLNRAVEKALRKDPRERWATAGAFLDALSPTSVDADPSKDDAFGPAVGAHPRDMTSRPAMGSQSAREDDRAQVAASALAHEATGPEWKEEAEQANGGSGGGIAALFGLVLIGAVAVAAVTGVPEDRLRSLLGQIVSTESESGAPANPDSPDGGSRPPISDPSTSSPSGITGSDVAELPEALDEPDADLAEGDPSSSAARLVVLGGVNQSGVVGAPLPRPIQLAVVDDAGRPLEGRWVRFVSTPGNGDVSSDSVQTDADGIAQVTWYLGGDPGPHEVVAQLSGEDGLEARFSAEARTRGLPVTPGVAAGGMHTCQLDAGGELTCWGANRWGQLGDGEWERRIEPETGVSGGPFVRIESGLDHTCALDPEGTAYCWGANEDGQLGDGTRNARPDPTRVLGAPAFTDLAVGASHTCGETGQGVIYCWGGNDDGQIGDGTTDGRDSPVRVRADLPLHGVVAGWRHTCALDDRGRAYCWGSNASGELGRSTQDPLTPSTPISGTTSFTELSAGNAHTCGVGQDSRVYCWGSNANGQLGDGTSQSRRVPTPVDSDRSFVSVAVGAVHACALDSSGSAHCWGRNLFGQLGDGTTTDRNRPVEVAESITFGGLHAFGSHTCGRTFSGDVLCWGYNAEGQIGDGTRENRTVPVRVGTAAPP